ncbi:MAG: gene transfer agent family protein [Alphaproteobacteria bacterium]|jgi:hypothetical protein|nr:gene transfer agent family protein [Alphaproteobacteria bacterium]MBN9592497.1 gene transfer agent family protein [Alphaproteobacteria bacterium]
MTNRIRGEAALTAGGKHYTLVLTLGALAEIEEGLGLADLSQITPRLKHVRAADLAIVTAALLRGGGHNLSPADVLKLGCDLGQLVTAVKAAFEAAGLSNEGGQGAANAAPFPGHAGSASGSA